MAWQVVSRSNHGDQTYLPRTGYQHAAGLALAPALLAEIPNLLPHYTLALSKQGESPQLLVLLGTQPGDNLYVHRDGRWIGSYVPAIFRAYPFRLVETSGGGEVLAIDASQVGQSEASLPFYDAQGEVAEGVAAAADFLRSCAHNQRITQEACSLLDQAGVLKPWPLVIEVEGIGRKIENLFCIDEAALNRLDGDAFISLRGAPMALAYGQIFSMLRIDQLALRARMREDYLDKERQKPDPSMLLEENQDDDLLDFSSFLTEPDNNKQE